MHESLIKSKYAPKLPECFDTRFGALSHLMRILYKTLLYFSIVKTMISIVKA